MALVVVGCRAELRRTPISGAPTAVDGDERSLWDEAEKFHEYVRDQHGIYNDEPLVQYLGELVARLLPQLNAPGAAVRLYIARDPFLNAFALPNGIIYLHAGIFSTLENEAQLATVLAHELSHFLRRHSLMTRRKFGADFKRNFESLQIAWYSQDLERQADRDAVTAISAAGYDPREAVKVFEAFKREEAEDGVPEPYAYGRHPTLDERIASCRRLAFVATEGGELGVERLRKVIGNVLLESARLNLKVGRPRRALASVQRHLADRPDSTEGLLLLGEAHRRTSDESEHLLAARDAYRRAIEVSPERAEPYRELGLLERQLGQLMAARGHLLDYLDRERNAADRAVIEGYLSE